MVEVGSLIINIWVSTFAWLSTNAIGSLYMFLIMMLFFKVIFSLGGKNK